MNNLICYTIYDIYVLKLEIIISNEFKEKKINLFDNTESKDYIEYIFNYYINYYDILEIYDLNNQILNIDIKFPINKNLLMTNKFEIALDILKYLIFFSDHDINILSEYLEPTIFYINDNNDNNNIDVKYTQICECFRAIYDKRTNKPIGNYLIKYNEIFNIDKNQIIEKYPSCGIIRLYNIKRDMTLCIGLELFHTNYNINGPIKISIDEERPIINGLYIDDKRNGIFWGISYKNREKIKFILWDNLMK